jgi:hypothetical protein
LYKIYKIYNKNSFSHVVPPQYVITDYQAPSPETRRQVKHSTRDVFDKDGKKLASVGGLGYADPIHQVARWKYANTRRKLFELPRAGQTRGGHGGFFADKLLW